MSWAPRCSQTPHHADVLLLLLAHVQQQQQNHLKAFILPLLDSADVTGAAAHHSHTSSTDSGGWMVTRGRGATEVIAASVHMSSPLPDEFMAPSLASFTVSCSFLEDQGVLQAISVVKERL